MFKKVEDTDIGNKEISDVPVVTILSPISDLTTCSKLLHHSNVRSNCHVGGQLMIGLCLLIQISLLKIHA